MLWFWSSFVSFTVYKLAFGCLLFMGCCLVLDVGAGMFAVFNCFVVVAVCYGLCLGLCLMLALLWFTY